MTKYANLLSPLQLGSLTIPNRVMMAPMTRGRAGPSYTANSLMAEYYAQRASAGIIVTEGVQTSLQARGWFQASDIYKPEHAKGWKLVTDAVHAKGGRIFCQLWHTGRTSHSNFREGMEGIEDPRSVAPSPLKRASASGNQYYTNAPGAVDIETPRELTTEEVKALKGEFENAARMAMEAGFDGVELHCANGYLLDEFLQSCSNKRTDEYGGSMEARFKVVEEVLEGLIGVFGGEGVGVRLSPNGVFNGMGSDDYRESFLYYAKRLGEMGIGYLHVMIGLGFGFHEKGEPMTMKEFREVFSGVLVANVGYDADSGEKEIADGNADMIAYGRPYISTPDLVERLEKGVEWNPEASKETYYSSADNVMTTEGYTDYPSVVEPVKVDS